MNNYQYYQPSSKDLKDKYGDCVMRALTKVLNRTWLEIFDAIVPISRELQCPYNSKTCYIAGSYFGKCVFCNERACYYLS